MEGGLGPVFRSLVKERVFGDVKLVDLQPDGTDVGAQFASSLTFLKLTVEGSSGKEIIPLVVKLTFSDPKMRIARNCDAMFHNEVTMYKDILPGLGVDKQMHPKMYYGIATNGADSVSDLLILENLKYKNAIPSKTKVFLDIDYISVAIKKIAEFHSYSYRLKHENVERFLEMTKKLKLVVLPKPIEHDLGAINAAAVERGMKHLLRSNFRVDELHQCINLLKYPYKTRRFISNPEEPFGVICHGDYCNNNILYKFDESGKPIDCVLFDFQLSQYGSPSIDLFFFLYMHTTSDSREKYWDQILKLYWDTLRESVPDHINIPSFAEFLSHFSKRAIYGYIITSFFLPVMLVEAPVKLDELFKLPLEEKIACMVALGGDEADHVIGEIVLHLLNRGYVDSFIAFCEDKKVDC